MALLYFMLLLMKETSITSYVDIQSQPSCITLVIQYIINTKVINFCCFNCNPITRIHPWKYGGSSFVSAWVKEVLIDESPLTLILLYLEKKYSHF